MIKNDCSEKMKGGVDPWVMLGIAGLIFLALQLGFYFFHPQVLGYFESYYFERAEKSNSIDDYKKYLARFPSGRFKSEALSALEASRFEKAKEKGSIEALERFIKAYPDGQYTNKAKSVLGKMAFRNAVEAAKADKIGKVESYLKITKSNMPELLKRFSQKAGRRLIVRPGEKDISKAFLKAGFLPIDEGLGIPCYRFNVVTKVSKGARHEYSSFGIGAAEEVRRAAHASVTGRLMTPKKRRKFTIKATYKESPPSSLSVRIQKRRSVEISRTVSPTQGEIDGKAKKGARRKFLKKLEKRLRAFKKTPIPPLDTTRSSSKTGRLFVNPTPDDARIRVLNIGPKYRRGMELKEGRYHIEVSHPGYATRKKWVNVRASQDNNFSFDLKAVSQRDYWKSSKKLGMNFVYIKPGSFMMGSPSDEPERQGLRETQHRVTLTKGFYLQTTEVTQGQWKAVMGSNPSRFKDCGDDCPVEKVSWHDVQKFIKKLNRMEGTEKYRLPTEAEWEYACRAGTTTPFSFGRCLSSDQANYDGNNPLTECSKGKYRKKTLPVGSFSPNAWGLYDMHGNVWEWCQDRWYRDYPTGSVTDPYGYSSGFRRVYRGGSWNRFARFCRSASRSYSAHESRYSRLGFRLACGAVAE